MAKKQDKLRRKLYYLRAVRKTAKGTNNKKFNLESLLRKMRVTKNTVAKTKESVSNFLFCIKQCTETNSEAILFSVSCVEEGRTALAVNANSTAAEEFGIIQQPPESHDYVNKEAYLMVSGNEVIYCGVNLLPASVAHYLNKLLEMDDHYPFELKHIPNIDKLKMIQAEGVKELDFHATMQQVTLNVMNEKADLQNGNKFIQIINQIKRKIQDLTDKEFTDEEIEALEDLEVGVSIRLIGNSRAKLEAKDFMTEEGKEIISLDSIPSGIGVITRRDNTVTDDDMKVRKEVGISRLGDTNSLEYDKACEAMLEYYKELKKDNITEV